MHTEAHLRFLRLGRLGQTSLGVAPNWLFGQLGGVLLFSVLAYATLGAALDPSLVMATGILLMAALNLTVIVHEAGHAVLAALAGAHVKAIVLMPLGGATVRAAIDSDRHARLTAAAGPLANVVAGALFVLLLVVLNPDRPLADVLIVNAALQVINGLTNLVPFGKFDGARVFARR